MAKNSEEHLNNLRHSAAHLLAAAVGELYPNSKKTIGPSIENGFYFDFDDLKISEADFPKIEEKMKEIVKTWKAFERQEVSKEEAQKEYKDNQYKLELIEEFSNDGQSLTFYKSGDYSDLCRGGHVPHPNNDLKHFKLLKVAGAYWRGNEKNKMLTRIYGTIWPTKVDLDLYLNQLLEAEKRDHKKLGKELDLFTFSELVGAGLPLWTPKGTILRNLLDDFVWQLRKEKEYQKVEIPHITKKELYETSGHWDKFKDELFKIETREDHLFCMKPMNCPHHTQIYNHLARSYRDLPQRYASTTMVYRDEQTGELSGLSRVRCITQDDAHVFCRENQVKEEFLKVWDIVEKFYGAFGFALKLRLSFHDPSHQEKYLGDPKIWQQSENLLLEIAKEKEADYFIGVGEAAFYGPKLDFMAKDSIGRQWQVATIQLDRNMPERFDLSCTNEKGESERIIMIHAAIMGSIERFLSIIIEHFAGSFPTWLSPNQVQILPIADRHLEYAQNISRELKIANIRNEIDDKAETLGSKIRDAQLQKIPYMIIIGDKEVEANEISIRSRDQGDLGSQPLNKFLENIKIEIDEKKIIRSS